MESLHARMGGRLRRLGAVNTILAGAALYGGYLILMALRPPSGRSTR